jgi:hypothetical protein
MRKSPNKLWALGPPLSLLLVAFAYYVKVPSFRDSVDRRFPWVKEHLAQFVPEPTIVLIKDPAEPGETKPAQPKPGDASLAASSAGKKPAKAASTPAPEPREEPLTMERFIANPALWPKMVKLRRTTEFPAVLNKKRIGTLQVLAGSEVHLVAVKKENLGVEYQGGSIWVPVAETDLTDQVKITSR